MTPIEEIIERLEQAALCTVECGIAWREDTVEWKAASALRSLEEENRRLREVAERIIACDDEAPDYGICDCIDNDGEHYQSADLAAALIALRNARAALSSHGEGGRS